MKAALPSNVKAWLVEPMPREVERAIARIASAADVRHIAVMPDVHLAREVCVGTVVATENLIYPAAVGSDIGCGIAAMAFDADADCFRRETVASTMLDRLRSAVPFHRHHESRLPAPLMQQPLGHTSLETIRRRDGTVQLGTLGRGNHFLEFQADEHGRLWLMVHSGSRAVGQAIRNHYEAIASQSSAGLKFLEADSLAGAAYLTDAQWARTYARSSRRAMIDAAAAVAREVLGITTDESTVFDCDHNHVRQEFHFGRNVWVHRKGAMSAADGEPGMVPGSMGTESFHVTGRGNPDSLRSTSHGAGRTMSRDEARRRISSAELRRLMDNVLFDQRAAPALWEEAPSAYKNVRAVLRAEARLTRIVRRLTPLLSYKGV